MKHTKSMVYRETWESGELELFAENDGGLYRTLTTSIIKSLASKYKRGKYDSTKAVDAWYTLASTAAKQYAKQIDSTIYFDVTARFTAATNFEKYYFEQVKAGF